MSNFVDEDRLRDLLELIKTTFADYTTTEKVIGTWIDQKPVYQIVTEAPLDFNEEVEIKKDMILVYDTILKNNVEITSTSGKTFYLSEYTKNV